MSLLVLLFVAYQLWGTGVIQAQNQHSLRLQFQGLLAANRHRSAAPGHTAAPPVPAPGLPVARLEIPEIGVDQVVVEGVGATQLALGPGHYPGTPLPGQPGNAGIAGHRTTHGAPFYDLNELVPGDRLTAVTLQGSFHYVVVRSEVVDPVDSSVLDPSPSPELTLTTCTPRFSAARRLVVVARLVSPAAPPGSPAPAHPPPAATDPDPLLQASDWLWVGVWGVAAAAAAVAIGLARRKLGGGRTWTVIAVAAPAVAVALFFLFGAINAMLPPTV